MKTYDYEETVKADVKEWISEEVDLKDYSSRADLEDYLNETLWTEDSVTGNGSGSYTFSTWEAEENLCHNLDLLGEALQEFGCPASYILDNGPEACDVTIRCYLLGKAISEALDDLGIDDDYLEELQEGGEEEE